jgi:hypothetical protein
VSPDQPEPELTRSDAGQREDEEAHGSTQLGRGARAVCGIAATASGVAGGFGVFTEGSNSGGVPVLLALAAFFGYLAISGQRLVRVKIGDHEAGFDRVVRVVTRRVLEDPAVPSSTKTEIAEVLDEVRPELSASARRAVSATLSLQQLEQAYQEMVNETVHQLFQDEYVGNVMPAPGRDDTFLRRDGHSIFVTSKFVEALVPVEAIVDLLSSYTGEVYSVSGGLLVSNRSLSFGAAQLLAASDPTGRFAFLEWDGKDDEALVSAIDSLLTRFGSQSTRSGQR